MQYRKYTDAGTPGSHSMVAYIKRTLMKLKKPLSKHPIGHLLNLMYDSKTKQYNWHRKLNIINTIVNLQCGPIETIGYLPL